MSTASSTTLSSLTVGDHDPGGQLRPARRPICRCRFDQPNGLCFSRDETQLFVNDTDRRHIRVFDVDADGRLSGGRVWAETTGKKPGAPDGMKIDQAGNLYCCGPGGIHVFAPDATCLGVIGMSEYTANFCFGDDDLRSLYVTASTSVYRLRLATPGRAQWTG